MGFWKVQYKAALVGLGVIALWAALDWMMMMAGWRADMSRDYFATFFAVGSGAAAVYSFS